MNAPILVPLDGSAFGEQALEPAVALARRAGVELHLVRVHVLSIPGAYPEATIFFSSELEKRARDADREYLAGFAALWPDVTVRTALLEGSIVSAIERYIAVARIGLVVMTTHGRSGLSRAWLGSIADALIRRVRIPVLLRRPTAEPVKRPPNEFSHILIPLDGSATAESILRHATRIGAVMGARYTLVQVVPPMEEMTAPAEAPPLTPSPETLRHVEKESLAYLEDVAGRLRAAGCAVDVSVIPHRQPAIGIIEKAEELGADMIAIATHGRTGLRRIALGSIADKVVRGTTLPVLVFRPPKVPAG